MWARNNKSGGSVYTGVNAAGVFTSQIFEDGTATFAGSATIGTYSSTANNTTGGQVSSVGKVVAQRTSTQGTSDVFAGYQGNSKNFSVTADGTGTFAGDVVVGNNPASGVTNNGLMFRATGGVIARRASGTDNVFAGYTSGNGSETSKITAAGDATFASSVTAQSYVTSSDQRFKENITDANSQLADVTALGNSLRNWDWTDDAPVSDRDTRFLGLVAQEAETISPGIVATIARTKNGDELTPEVVVPAVYETRTVPAVLDEEGEVVEPETTEEVLVTEEQVTPATYEQLDDSYKGIKNDVLIMKLLGAVAELSAKVAALEAAN